MIMKAMKGFIHIIEIIIVSLLVFFVFIQFSYVPSMEITWSGAKLKLQGNDLLFSLDRLDMDWTNPNDPGYDMLSELLPSNTIYKVIVIDKDSELQIIVDNPVPRDSVTLSFYKTINGNIYEVIFTLGYLY